MTRPTPSGDAEEVWAALAAAVTEAAGDHDIAGAGIGSAGPLDAIAGTVSPVNIPGWRGFPVRDRLSALLGGRPAVLVNDAVAGAVGEYRYGAGRGARAMLGMVVSTGVGGGLILDGRVYAGTTGNAGHIGHTVVDLGGEPCPCGSRGCVETMTSGPAMVRWALREGWTPRRPGRRGARRRRARRATRWPWPPTSAPRAAWPPGSRPPPPSATSTAW